MPCGRDMPCNIFLGDVTFKNDTIKYRSLSPFLNKKSWIKRIYLSFRGKK
jgi:hypothetical protein